MFMKKKYHDHFESDCYYHIYNRSINKEQLFLNQRNYKFFLLQWKKYLSGYLRVYSYCLIPNHFHFFVQVNQDVNNDEIEKAFKYFFCSYSLAFNKENNRSGSLFQKGFKRIRIEEDSYFTNIIHYIHNNPIHHGFVNSYNEWNYSSYNSIISEKPTLVGRSEVLEWFGGREKFIDFHLKNIKFEKIDKYLFE